MLINDYVFIPFLDMKVAFSVFDRNEDGKISKEELAEVLKEAEVVFTDEQLNDFMERVDKDGNYYVIVVQLSKRFY